VSSPQPTQLITFSSLLPTISEISNSSLQREAGKNGRPEILATSEKQKLSQIAADCSFELSASKNVERGRNRICAETGNKALNRAQLAILDLLSHCSAKQLISEIIFPLKDFCVASLYPM
jgi:hypothetical protein